MIRAGLVAVLFVVACRTAPAATPASCCTSYDDIHALDGKRVAIVGVYEPWAVRKGKRDPNEDAASRTVAIRMGDVSVMLDVYYASEGERSESEIARFANKKVRVVGTLHRSTPERMAPGGIPMQTMIGPCVTEIESIETAE